MSTTPNILFITTDHQRYDCVGANGNPWIKTPELDRLAAEGVSFERCYVQNPVCMPSRASIWTGRYPQNHRVTTNGIALPGSEVTIARTFQQAGYCTANVGKLHFLPHYGRDHTRNDMEYDGYGYEMNLLSDEPGCYPDAYIQWIEKTAPQHLEACRVPVPHPDGHEERNHFHGWVFDAPEEYSHPAWVAHEVEQFLKNRNDSRPFFLSAGFYAPHPPLNPPGRFLDFYNPSALPLPKQHPADMERSPYRDITPEQWKSDKAFFYAMCSLADYYTGRILAALKETGQDKNTIVVFMSDHGDALGDHGQINKGPSNYESIVRVPCILRWPEGLPAGHRVKGMIESIDLFPTLCEACDIPVPAGVKGQSLLALARGETNAGRDSVLIEMKDPRTGFSVKTLRTDDYKYFRCNDGSEVLYDLSETDEEVFNRACEPEYRSAVEQMRDLLLSRLIQAEDDLPEKTHPY